MRFMACAGLLWLSMWFCSAAHAEQKQQVGAYEVHYIILPTTFLKPDIATRYNLTRGRDRALINVSIVDAQGRGHRGTVTGRSRNLLGQSQTLDFTEVTEQDAVYYLALLRHADEEHHRVELHVEVPDGEQATIELQQTMYWNH